MALRSLVLCAARASKRQRSFSRRSARSTIEVKGLRAGGDDYLPKPYSFSELLARAEVLARPRPSQEEMVYRVGDLELDRLSRQVTRGGNEIVLLPTEFLLLEFLMKHAGQVVTRTMLLEDVWGYHFDRRPTSLTCTSHACDRKLIRASRRICCIPCAAQAS